MIEKCTGALDGRIMTDEKLYGLCRKYGENALFFRRKFIGLLPEVLRRRLYEKKGFGTIFEFAAKLCGVSEKQVRRVLNLEKRFEEMPVLKEMLVSGEVSANKLAKIASIATVENQDLLAEQARVLPCRALETLVKDERLAVQIGISAGLENGNANRFQKPLFDYKSVHVNIKEPRLDNDIKQQLYDLQEKGIDINFLLREMLEKREAGIAAAKNAVGEEELKKLAERAAERAAGEEATWSMGESEVAAPKSPSRYISVRVRKILNEEYGDKCSMSGCGRIARQIHHTQRFALAGTHDPRYMAPMCEEHHKIAHSIDAVARAKWRRHA